MLFRSPDRKRQKGSNHNDDGGSGTQADRHSANDAVGVHWGLLAATPKSPGMQLQRPLQDSLKNEQKSSLSKQHKAHLDSGCSGNMVGVIAGDQVSQNSSNEIQFFDSEHKVKNVRKDRGSVVLGDDSSLQCRCKGEVWGLKNVLLVEGLKHHLISVSRQVDDFESHVAFGPNHAHRAPIKDFEVPKTAKVIADRVGHLYECRTAEKGLFTDVRVKNILEHVHQSCGHVSIKLMLKGIQEGTMSHPLLQKLSRKQIINMIDNVKVCTACGLSKGHLRPVHRNHVVPRTIAVYALILVDFSAHITPRSREGHEHVLYIMDDASSELHAVTCQQRSDAPAADRKSVV